MTNRPDWVPANVGTLTLAASLERGSIFLYYDGGDPIFGIRTNYKIADEEHYLMITRHERHSGLTGISRWNEPVWDVTSIARLKLDFTTATHAAAPLDLGEIAVGPNGELYMGPNPPDQHRPRYSPMSLSTLANADPDWPSLLKFEKWSVVVGPEERPTSIFDWTN